MSCRSSPWHRWVVDFRPPALLLALLWGMWGCSSQPLGGFPGSSPASVHPLDCPVVGPDEPLFLDASSDDGIDWEYEHAFTDGDQWPDELSMGLVADDFDGDGWVDLYITNRAVSPSYFRNTGNGRFEEVPDAGGADPGPLSTGATAADVDGDGDPDLLVMLDTEVRLYRNDDGAFVDITEESGLAFPRAGVTWLLRRQNEWPGAPPRGNAEWDCERAATGSLRAETRPDRVPS